MNIWNWINLILFIIWIIYGLTRWETIFVLENPTKWDELIIYGMLALSIISFLFGIINPKN